MTFLTDWQTEIDASLASIISLIDKDQDLELTYGLVAAGVLWPIREKIEEYDTEAIQAIKQLVPTGNRALLHFMLGWSDNQLAAVRQLAQASKESADLRASLDQLILKFNALSLFLSHVIKRKVANQELPATNDIKGLVQGLLVNIGGVTTVQELHITMGSMIAGGGHQAAAPEPQPKTEELLKPYLEWLITQHERLEMRSIKQSGTVTGVPLESVYVALRGDRTSPYERQQSALSLDIELHQLEQRISEGALSFEEQRALLWQALGRAPWMPSLEERDRPHLFQTSKTEKLSLGEAFCRERWLAILGDPGSGKTTVARWLTLKLARALLAGQERLLVPEAQVDPAARGSEHIDLGPVRLPILVRIAEFADARRENPSLLLADFLGFHSWLGQVPTFRTPNNAFQGEKLSGKQLNQLMKTYLKQQQAVILLDGLDEISAVDKRIDVLRAVERFIYDWVITPAEEEKIRFTGSLVTVLTDYPATRGGNQIVITSRIAGYHAAPLGGQIAHFTIDPMSNQAVDAFCDAWMATIHPDRETATREAEAFKAEIHNPNNPGVRELASNPLLLTILALIYQEGHSALPRQRVNLYQMAVSNLVQIWQQRGHNLLPDEVIAVLIHLAYYIHENYSTGLIEETVLRDQIARSLASYRNIPYERLSTAFNQDINLFMRRLREEIGLLAARGERLYGFLHLSFQEYFSALYLLRIPEKASTMLTEKLDKPRWREPLLLAFGYISLAWPIYMREELIRSFLQANDDTLKHLLPRSAILLANSLSEMAALPSDPILRQIILSLLETYTRKERFSDADLLYQTIEEAFRNMRKTQAASIVELTLVEEIQNMTATNPVRGFAAAQILFKLQWYTPRAARALSKALPLDSASWGWFINRSLIEISRLHPGYLPLYDLSFRQMLAQDQELLAFVKEDPIWLRLALLLFGGILPPDPSADIEEQQKPIEFLPTNIYRQALISTRLLISIQRRDLAGLESELRSIWQHSQSPMERAEALLGLFALEVPVSTLVHSHATRQDTTFEVAISYAELIIELLQPLFQRAVSKLKNEIVVACEDQHRLFEEDIQALDLIRRLDKFEKSFYTQPTRSILVPYWRVAMFMAQFWVDCFAADDVPYLLAVNFDTSIDFETDVLVGSLALLQEIHISNKWLTLEAFPTDFMSARDVLLSSDIAKEPDILAEALNVIAGMKPSVDIWRSWALEEIAPLLLERQPECLLEALILCMEINEPEYRLPALGAYDAALAQQDNIAELLFQRAMVLSNPLHRARSLWRLMQILPLKYRQPGLEEALRSTEHIADAEHRSRMSWRLARLLPTSPRQNALYQDAYKYARKIADPSNRARALARLVVHFPGQEKRLLSLILDSVEKIKRTKNRAEMLQKLRSMLNTYPELWERLVALDERLPSPHRWLAQDQLLPQLLAYTPKSENVTNYTLVTLIVGLSELHGAFGIPTELSEIWLTLVDKRRREGSLKALLKRGVKNGLKLTAVAADALNVLIHQGDLPSLNKLFPLVQEPQHSLIPLLQRWLQIQEQLVQQMASLFLAEADVISVKTLPHLLKLLEQGEDRLRLRASLALYYESDGPPRFKSSQVGEEELAMLVEYRRRRREHTPALNNTVTWFYENFRVNEGQRIVAWARGLQYGGDRDAAFYAHALCTIKYLSRDAWDGFLEALANGDEAVQSLLLLSLIQLLFRFHPTDLAALDKTREKRLRLLLRQLCLSERHGVRQRALEVMGFLPGIDADEKQFLQQTIEFADDILAKQALITLGLQTTYEQIDQLQSYLRHARQSVRQAADQAFVACLLKRFGLVETDEALMSVVEQMIAAMGEAPLRFYHAAIGVNSYRWINNYGTNATKLGGIVIERFPILLERVVVDLVQVLEGLEPPDHMSVEAMLDQTWVRDTSVFSIATAAAERLPTAFANLIDAERVQLHLLRWSKQGNALERPGAITMLSLLRHLDVEIANAICHGLNDVVYVQSIALQAVERFRMIRGDVISTLAQGLFDPSAAFAYATVQLFLALGRAESTSFAERQRIMSILADAINDPTSKREVYVLKQDVTTLILANGSRTVTDNGIIIAHLGQLGSAMEHALVQISGIGRVQSLEAE